MWSDPSQAFLGKHAPCLYHLFEDIWPASLLPGAQRFLSPAHLGQHQASVCHLIHQVSYDLAYDTQTQEVQQGCPPPQWSLQSRLEPGFPSLDSGPLVLKLLS